MYSSQPPEKRVSNYPEYTQSILILNQQTSFESQSKFHINGEFPVKTFSCYKYSTKFVILQEILKFQWKQIVFKTNKFSENFSISSLSYSKPTYNFLDSKTFAEKFWSFENTIEFIELFLVLRLVAQHELAYTLANNWLGLV